MPTLQFQKGIEASKMPQRAKVLATQAWRPKFSPETYIKAAAET